MNEVFQPGTEVKIVRGESELLATILSVCINKGEGVIYRLVRYEGTERKRL